MLDPLEIVDGFTVKVLKERLETITDVKSLNQKLLLKGKILQVSIIYLNHYNIPNRMKIL